MIHVINCMKSKIILAIGLFSLSVSGLLNSCSATPASSPLTSTTLSSNTSDVVLQTGLPLNVTAPADGATIRGDTVSVQGQTIAGATVSVNGNLVIADASGIFIISIYLDEGLNAIDVIATDDTITRVKSC
jgi:hypothetical protein